MIIKKREEIEKMVSIDLNIIRSLAKKIGPKYPQINSIYLFGSVARAEVDNESDIDLFFLIDGKCSNFFDVLVRDEDYKSLEDWALEKVEGGLTPLICNTEELVNDFQTLYDKLLLEGIRLFGSDLKELESTMRHKKKDDGPSLLDLIRTL